MDYIKEFRVENTENTESVRVRVFSCTGQVINDIRPVESLIREVTIPKGNLSKKETLVDGFIQKLKNAGYKEA
ncbi:MULTISPECIES: hypothetical protein [Buttiauxella]|jgi:hypothetical protein|uniref:Uncharacterized protein n=1 Tax=Buttiauxella agrestis TaxID=82977 RepID=A0A381KNA6_9ENTR|nr:MULTISPECIES: hypothetical protein [Buttiauxella]TDX12054.1 hypothetical protein EDF88_4652 [Buttiauxella sp. BIGb0552]SUY92779.1 Uncharacterised protein [Buttiauxella agrestis]